MQSGSDVLMFGEKVGRATHETVVERHGCDLCCRVTGWCLLCWSGDGEGGVVEV